VITKAVITKAAITTTSTAMAVAAGIAIINPLTHQHRCVTRSETSSR
jgi:hypothetical protein